MQPVRLCPSTKWKLGALADFGKLISDAGAVAARAVCFAGDDERKIRFQELQEFGTLIQSGGRTAAATVRSRSPRWRQVHEADEPPLPQAGVDFLVFGARFTVKEPFAVTALGLKCAFCEVELGWVGNAPFEAAPTDVPKGVETSSANTTPPKPELFAGCWRRPKRGVVRRPDVRWSGCWRRWRPQGDDRLQRSQALSMETNHDPFVY